MVDQKKVIVNLGLVGPGLIGKSFMKMVDAYNAQKNINSHLYDINIVAIARSKTMYLSQGLEHVPFSQLANVDNGLKVDLNAFTTHLLGKKSGSCPSSSVIPILVDCTSCQTIAESYPHWMEKGIHIVTPNKKAFSSDLSLFSRITAPSNTSLVYHEATVGAGLPIISTIHTLLRTGDEITKIEGIFSGTMSYIFNNFSPSSPAKALAFSDVVKVAKENGYTEPDPRDDLNGMDVARKVVILGRVCGSTIGLNNLPVQNIVPEELRCIESADEFMKKLPGYDDYFAKLNADARAANKVLRYVGTFHPVTGKSSVEMKQFDNTHAFAGLKGSDNIIAIHSKRYKNPLIIQGAGAGDDVTATGVFGDVLTIVDRLC